MNSIEAQLAEQKLTIAGDVDTILLSQKDKGLERLTSFQLARPKRKTRKDVNDIIKLLLMQQVLSTALLFFICLLYVKFV